MSFAGINLLAVVAAAITAWLVGAAWYMVLSGPWVRAQGQTMEAFKARAAAQGAAAWLPYALTFMAELLMAWGFAGLLGHLGAVTIRGGLISGFFVWLSFILPVVAVNNLFGMRRPMLTVIDSGHWLAALLVMGLVLGLFGA